MCLWHALTRTGGTPASCPQETLHQRPAAEHSLMFSKQRCLPQPFYSLSGGDVSGRDVWARSEPVSDGWDPGRKSTATPSSRGGVGGSQNLVSFAVREKMVQEPGLLFTSCVIWGKSSTPLSLRGNHGAALHSFRGARGIKREGIQEVRGKE